MHVTSEEVVHMKGNISFLSSWAKCLTSVNVCPRKHFACAGDSKHVVPGKFKRQFPEKKAKLCFILEGISYGISFSKLELQSMKSSKCIEREKTCQYHVENKS